MPIRKRERHCSSWAVAWPKSPCPERTQKYCRNFAPIVGLGCKTYHERTGIFSMYYVIYLRRNSSWYYTHSSDPKAYMVVRNWPSAPGYRRSEFESKSSSPTPPIIHRFTPSSRKQNRNGKSDTLAWRSSISSSSSSHVLCWMRENLGWMVSLWSGWGITSNIPFLIELHW